MISPESKDTAPVCTTMATIGRLLFHELTAASMTQLAGTNWSGVLCWEGCCSGSEIGHGQQVKWMQQMQNCKEKRSDESRVHSV